MTVLLILAAQAFAAVARILRSCVPSLLLLVGLYFPTTVSPKITVLSAMAYLICIGLLVAILFRKGGHIAFPKCIILFSIVPLLMCFTFISPLNTTTLGAAVGYLLLSLLLMVNLRGLTVPPRLWIAVNVLNIAAGFGIVLGVEAVNNFVLAHYATSYDDLLPVMLALRKPVLSFGTHSLAAFFLYLFFWLNLEAFRSGRGKLYLSFSICYLVLTLCLTSVSGILLFLAGCTQLVYLTLKSIRHKILWAYAALCLVLLTASVAKASFDLSPLIGATKEILSNRGSGFMGRFLQDGTMHYDVGFIGQHPFTPVGFSFREGFMFGDSGWVEYMLRGSVPVLLLIYAGLYCFLRRNLESRAHAHFLFAAILIFETGMSTLIYIRMLFLLPVFVVFLNDCHCFSFSPGHHHHSPQLTG